MRLSRIIFAAFGIFFTASAPAEAAYAIAFNTATGRAVANNGSFDLEEVKKTALANCGSGCRIVASGKKNCAAVVEAVSTGTRAWTVAFGTTTATATSSATHDCRRKGGVTCKPAAAICD